MSYPSYDLTIPQLVERAHGAAKDAGWWDDQKLEPDGAKVLWASEEPLDPALVKMTIPEKLCLIHSEVSEALEAYRLPNRPVDDVYFLAAKPTKPEGIPAELADVVIRVADLAGALGIDLEAAIRQKMAYNATRAARHGGKVC